jgi:ribosome biogenesis protein UTP30
MLDVHQRHKLVCYDGIRKTTPGRTPSLTTNSLSQLPHPALPPPPTTSICLITKDPQREYKDLIAQHGIKFIERVVGVDKLKGKFKPFEPRRQLMRDHELWLCDDRVVDMMPQLLGKMFFEAKK